MKTLFLRMLAVATVALGLIAYDVELSMAMAHSVAKPDIDEFFWIGILFIILGAGGIFLKSWALIPLIAIYALVGAALLFLSPWKVPFPFELINCFFGILLLTPLYIFILWNRDKRSRSTLDS